MRWRVLLVATPNHVPIDISLGALPFEERLVARSSEFGFAPGAVVRTCSAEDLVVLKAVADRAQDWLDVEGIIVRQGRTLDRTLIREELMALLELKEDLSAGEALRKLFAKHG